MGGANRETTLSIVQLVIDHFVIECTLIDEHSDDAYIA